MITIKSRNQTENKSDIQVRSILKIVNYVLFNEYIILIAWKDLLLKNYDVLWEKAESTRF